MKTVKKPSPVPIYLIGVVWLCFALFFTLYRPVDYVICAVVSAAVYFLSKLVFRTRVIEVPAPKQESKQEAQTPPKEEAAPEKKKAEPSLTPEQRELIQDRDRAVGELRRLNDNIEDPTISAQIDRMETTTGKIFGYVLEHPEKRSQIRRFINYYLPTTIKLLNAYDRMDDAGVSGTNIDGTKGKITETLSTIVTAFDKQLDALFQDEALDISADITVLEQMMAREGLTDHSDFKTASNP